MFIALLIKNVFGHTLIITCILVCSFGQRIGQCFTKVEFVQIVITAVNCGCIENQIIRGSAIEPGAFLHMLGWTTSLFITCLAGQILMDAVCIDDIIICSKYLCIYYFRVY